MIVIDLRNQQEFDVDPKAIQKIIFIENLDQTATIVLIIEEVTKVIWGILQGTVRVL